MEEDKRKSTELDIGTVTNPGKSQRVQINLHTGFTIHTEGNRYNLELDARLLKFIVVATVVGVPALCYALGRLGH